MQNAQLILPAPAKLNLMLHILGRSVGLGFRGSVPAMAGCLLAA